MTLLTQTAEMPTAVAAGGSAVRPGRDSTASDGAAGATFARLLGGTSQGAETFASTGQGRAPLASHAPGYMAFASRSASRAEPLKDLVVGADASRKLETFQSDRSDSADWIAIMGVVPNGSMPGLEGPVGAAGEARDAAFSGLTGPHSGAAEPQHLAALGRALRVAMPAPADAHSIASNLSPAQVVGAAAAVHAAPWSGPISAGAPGSALPAGGNTLPPEQLAGTALPAPLESMWGMFEGVAPPQAQWLRGPAVTDPELAARQTPSAADSRARVGEHADVAMAARATTASAQSAGRAAAPQLGVLTSLLADVTRGATRARMAQGMAQGMARGEPASRPLSTTASTLDFAAHGIRGSLRTLDASAATMLDAASLRAALASGAVSTGPQQAESAATALEAAVLESDATGAEDAEPVPVAARAPLRAGAGPVPVSFSAPGTIDADAPGEDGIAGAATQSLPGHAGQSGATPGQPGAGVSPLPLAEASAPARADTGSANAPSAPATDLTATAHPPVTVSGGTIEAGPLGDRLIALAQHGQLQAKLRLHPAELGALEVRIKLHDDGASVAISSPHGQVRDAIEASLPRLRELFAAQGMNLVDVDVSSGGGNAPHGDGESLRHREAAVRHAVGTSEAAQPRAAMPDRAPVHERTHRIDLLA